MGIKKQVWISDISEQLLEGVEFAARAQNHDALVSNEKVNIPQAGTVPSVAKNRSAADTAPVERTDTVLTYDVDSYSTDPILIKGFDEAQTSYSKRQSVLFSHMSALNETLGNNIAINWGGGATNAAFNQIATSGAAGGALPASATGTRKILTPDDLRSAAKALDQQNVPMSGRVALLTTSMFYELFEDSDIKQMDVMGKATLPDGVIGRLYGFDIMIRPTVLRMTSAGNIKATATAGAAGDLFGSICYHPSFVARALGSVNVFLDEGAARSYGDIFSSEVFMGASSMYTNGKGIVTLKSVSAA